MKLPPSANLFKLSFIPQPSTLYRGLRHAIERNEYGDAVASGKYLYSLHATAVCTDSTDATNAILKHIVQKNLANVISSSDQFFDINPRLLSGSVVRELLHKEEIFSIARTFQLQILFAHDQLYLVTLAGLRLYNRLRLPEVLELIGAHALSLPMGALCFAGKGAGARWRDCQILSLSDDSAIVKVPSMSPPEVTLPRQRVIPRLATSMIKRLLYLRRSRTNVEQKLKDIRSGLSGGEGEYIYQSSAKLLREHFANLFPLEIGQYQVQLDDNAQPLDSLSTNTLRKQFQCRSNVNGQRDIFDSPLQCLQGVRFPRSNHLPIAIFATPETEQKMLALLASLNSPPDSVGGFRGMPSHFGIELKQVTGSPYIVSDVEQYLDVAKQFVLSPRVEQQSALALIALSEEEESYAHAVPLYYRLKALLARSGHASQMVAHDTLTNKYARWNLALNLAAKLGAIPWTLNARTNLQPVDMFLGFSFSTIRTERLGQSRNIAYVNVFDGTGTWQVFFTDGSVFSFEERLKTFPRIAAEAIRSATDNPENLRVIEVHFNKRFGYKERQAIAQGIHAHAPEASIIFVSITDDHPVRFFDPSRPQWSCPRGTVFQAGASYSYVQTIEADKWSGLPRPLRIQVFRDFSSTSEDPIAVSERILGLTRLNWRSVKDYSSLPVTILYSSLVARLTNYFSLTDWKEIDHHLKRTPWFL